MNEEFQRLVDAQKEQDELGAAKAKISVREFFSGRALKPLTISMAIMFFQQFTGINAVVYYTVSIFQSAGSSIDSRYATIIVGIVQLLFTAASGFFVDRFGRRILLFASAIGIIISLAAMGTFFHYKIKWGDAEATSRLGWLPLVSLIVFFAFFSCGFANVPFIIMGELFPFRLRSVLGPISSSFNLLCAFTVVRSFPNLEKTMGRNGAFWFFMSCTIASLFFVYFFLPETKGKSLEEIETLFGSSLTTGGNNKIRPVTTVLRVIQVTSSSTQTDPITERGGMTSNSSTAAVAPSAHYRPPQLSSAGAVIRPRDGGWTASAASQPTDGDMTILK